jgi:hypothetical protein
MVAARAVAQKGIKPELFNLQKPTSGLDPFSGFLAGLDGTRRGETPLGGARQNRFHVAEESAPWFKALGGFVLGLLLQGLLAS